MAQFLIFILNFSESKFELIITSSFYIIFTNVKTLSLILLDYIKNILLTFNETDIEFALLASKMRKIHLNLKT